MNHRKFHSIRFLCKGRKKSTSGQAQLLAALVFLFLIPAGVIIAQNATNITNFTLPLEGHALSNITQNQTLPTLPDSHNETNITFPPNTTSILNKTQFPSPQGKEQKTNSTQNITSLGDKNETDQNHTVQTQTQTENLNTTTNETEFPENSTSQHSQDRVPSDSPDAGTFNLSNYTNQNQTSKREENITQPPILEAYGHPILSVSLSLEKTATRGENTTLIAVIKNTGNSTAKEVHGFWHIQWEDIPFSCHDIKPKSACSNKMEISIPLSAPTGKSEITAEVFYHG